ncbi:sensor histidine kinase [Glycomyces xiaoerkulensis]|uniref:sensor histidine kinase n=1 Tax=Glycomyces xiaoerkulensis TaxID=2038139 RepID=UPI000C25E2D4|nr:sensor histidine kinase [Glycomyces xiaoerkulensis]
MGGDEPRRGLLAGALIATLWVAAGVGIGVLALMTLPLVGAVAALRSIRIGRPLVRPLLQWVRVLADLERRRLGRLGHEIESPYHDEPPDGETGPVRGVLDEPTVRRDLSWLFMQATFGIVLGTVTVQLLSNGIHDATLWLWWPLVDESERSVINGLIGLETWSGSVFGVVVGIAQLILWLLFAPRLLRYQCRPGVNLLGPDPDIDLSERVARLAATRAAALDAHAIELRRIERALHDGAQNRIVGVAVLVGAARREVERDPGRADEILARAQDSAELALSELRAVVRSILPPVLENRGLEGALSALASECAVPCRLTVDVPVRCPASVEATAYFVVAESLTNVAKHSGASRAEVGVSVRGDRLHVVVTDDGRGGADPAGGSGLAGIGRRVEAHDGEVAVVSPEGGPTEIRVELPCGS